MVQFPFYQTKIPVNYELLIKHIVLKVWDSDFEVQLEGFPFIASDLMAL